VAYLLDTNVFEALLSGDENVSRNLNAHLSEALLSSVAAEEAMAGRLNAINRARAPRTSLSLPQAHEDFADLVRDLRRLPILVYSQEADATYKTFSPAVLRHGTQDCRIAAQAIAHGLTVVTRNFSDFTPTGVDCVDWTI
jgi:tRNA(fMet)-specific endonuclease VapC